MKIEISVTMKPIPQVMRISDSASNGEMGSWVEFYGVVRNEEGGRPIQSLRYELYEPMALKEMHRLLTELGAVFRCQQALVIHRYGVIPVGESAIYVGIASRHRHEGFSLLSEFMNRLKVEVPIWKMEALS